MLKILVVEDEERLCSAIVAYLQSRGFKPIASHTAQEAVQTLSQGDIGLVVLDLQLVNGNGLDVLRQIRGSLGLINLPVLAVSAWDIDPDSYDYLEPGDYLIKPFDMRRLDPLIKQHLELVSD